MADGLSVMQKLCAVPFNAKAEAARRYSPAQCIGLPFHLFSAGTHRNLLETAPSLPAHFALVESGDYRQLWEAGHHPSICP